MQLVKVLERKCKFHSRLDLDWLNGTMREKFYRVRVNTMRSESRCALRLRYVDLVVSILVAVEV
jgi:hypothetical protein